VQLWLRLNVRPPLRLGCDEQLSPKRDCHWVQGHGARKTSSSELACERHGGALFVRGNREWSEAQRSVQMQIVDVFALKVVTVSPVDPNGRLLLEGRSSVAGWAGAGRWSKLPSWRVTNAQTKERWVVLATQQRKSLGGLVLAGADWHRCRQELLRHAITTPVPPIVPGEPEAGC